MSSLKGGSLGHYLVVQFVDDKSRQLASTISHHVRSKRTLRVRIGSVPLGVFIFSVLRGRLPDSQPLKVANKDLLFNRNIGKTPRLLAPVNLPGWRHGNFGNTMSSLTCTLNASIAPMARLKNTSINSLGRQRPS